MLVCKSDDWFLVPLQLKSRCAKCDENPENPAKMFTLLFVFFPTGIFLFDWSFPWGNRTLGIEDVSE